MHVHIIVHNCRTQHRADLIIFPLILQTIIIAQMMSTGGEGQGIQKHIPGLEYLANTLAQHYHKSALF